MWGHKKFTAKLGNLSLLCVTFGKSLNHFAYFCPVNYKIEDNKTLVFFFIDQTCFIDQSGITKELLLSVALPLLKTIYYFYIL